MTRVSTYTITNNLFNQTQRLQGNYATANLQSSSGLKSESFEGIAGDSQRLLALNAEYATLNGQALAMNTAQTRLSTLKNITTTIGDALNSATSLIANALSGLDLVGGAASNAEQARVIRDEIASLLNSRVGGTYIFGGSVYDAPPVDLTEVTYDPGAAPATPTTAYYKGDTKIDSVRTSSSLTISYGVTADNDAFERAFRALTLVIESPADDTLLRQALDLVRDASYGVAQIGGDLIAKSNIVTAQASINTNTSDYLEQLISGVRDADAATAAVQISQIETQLQASYGSLAKLLQLRLTDYLR